MLVQGSRGDMIPAFDLEGFHGTMSMRLDVVQGQRTWRAWRALAWCSHHRVQTLFKTACTKG